MRIVGLTGGIASGKSTVSRELQRRGLPVIDADQVAHDVQKKGTWGYRRVVVALGLASRFRLNILDEDGEIDRSLLGDLVFQNPEMRKALNRAVQPAIALGLLLQLAQHWYLGAPVVVLDAPLLFEAKIHVLTNPVVVVYCEGEAQLERLVHRNGLTREQAQLRIGSQMPLEAKRARADVVVDNSGLLQETMAQVNDVYKLVIRPLSWKHVLLFNAGVAAVLAAPVMAIFFAVRYISFCF
eukprot:jgi/Mesen1/8733/ME000052S08164